jgi:hypothetical protein
MYQYQLAKRRQIALPWDTDEVPVSCDKATLIWSGTTGTVVQGLPFFGFPHTMTAVRNATGTGWRTYDVTEQTTGIGQLPQNYGWITGTAQVSLPYWIPPVGLAGLIKGQVLDNDTVVKSKLAVSAVKLNAKGRKTVYMVRTGPGYTLTTGYDRAKGLMTYFLLDLNMIYNTQRTEMNLTTPAL